ncbi:myo-inositol-1-phosphate synthase [Parabacteroides sp. PF5-5]|uniref:inositol-3-phosphate synthase n=1 Tax=unclassified Parabacteroides TaxID=2649774 RepID=UPI0024760918|nr:MULTISPECIES: inositol-3-phosphate synthase [unclassified Parabacteroides]MDH6304448.1 myo-inositol-1-phosphate synthase [Parabacteroides sp. PH5-39]MDH6315399.1 myo-inositol-1-phosphate synthase [Parabacteroides sp. PF5-13]MDH6319107.1 myo-inositol-1-phosphate synthase [Parabacteroides sp. PH5-13]MDH6322837.1 myo-inositol-1-phosphate synthase [Parabacteroides sp. PH5-8]MDH6326591.1 myo-inositol-1-phosphate synthase [Parabacteroides sp. PH5-41]
MEKVDVKDAKGKLGVLIVGIGGAVSSTFITGTLSVRKGISKPIGSLTQLATIRLGKRNENRFPKIKDVVPLSDLNDLVFGGWDIFKEDIYEATKHAEVLSKDDIEVVKDELAAIKPMPAVFDQDFVKRLHGTHVKTGATRWDLTEQLREDIRKFKADNQCERVVVMWAASTEVYIPQSKEHESLAAFEQALKADNKEVISPSMCYAYASIAEGCPFIMGAPNLCIDIPAMWELADKHKVAICGKDYKTGQTMLKTVLAPMLKTRMLGLEGWFSTNILGNRDGEVLDDPGSFKTKEVSKLSVIDTILQPDVYPDLYGNVYHKVRINYYPPRKDNKEGWDNIDIIGWMNYPMQLKVDFLCRDSILAAPLCLDLVLFADLAQRCGFYGIQDWLSFYFKSPMHKPDRVPEHDLFIQHTILKNTLRKIIGEPTLDYLD